MSTRPRCRPQWQPNAQTKGSSHGGTSTKIPAKPLLPEADDVPAERQRYPSSGNLP